MSDNCDVCRESKGFLTNLQELIRDSKDETITWHQWDTAENGHTTKFCFEDTVDAALMKLKNQLTFFLWHVYIKLQQEVAYADGKKAAQSEMSTMALLQMDFAENYTCTFQDEIQTAHWHQKQITVYTVMVYHREQTQSYIIVSDVRDHEKRSVAAYTQKIITIMLGLMPTINRFNIWTDGPSSQYKSKYIFALLAKLQVENNIKMEWNYFATSHGKGPNDALGGRAKATVHRLVMTRRVIAQNANSFAKALREVQTGITTINMTANDIEDHCQTLNIDQLWDSLPASVSGTRNTHFVSCTDGRIIRKDYSLAENLLPCHPSLPWSSRNC